MDRYLVESSHEQGDCRHIVKDVYSQGFLYHCDWGCMGGVHKSWVIVDAVDAKQALLVVPYVLRKNATATMIMKFDSETVKQWSD